MIAKLTLLFATATLLELSILIPLGKAIGLPATLALVIGTAAVGGTLAKRQGVTIWNRIQRELRQGELPGDSLLDGLAVLIAGTLLLTPGVLTDAAGILLLIPPCRAPLKALIKKYAKERLDQPEVTYIHGGAGFGGGHQPGSNRNTARPDEDVIDVEAVEADDDPDDEPLEAVLTYPNAND